MGFGSNGDASRCLPCTIFYTESGISSYSRAKLFFSQVNELQSNTLDTQKSSFNISHSASAPVIQEIDLIFPFNPRDFQMLLVFLQFL